MSSQHAFPGRPVGPDSGIEVTKNDEFILLGYFMYGGSEFRIEFFFVFIRVLHCGSIDTDECDASVVGERQFDGHQAVV